MRIFMRADDLRLSVVHRMDGIVTPDRLSVSSRHHDLAVVPPEEPDIPEGNYKEQYAVIVTCADQGDQERTYNELLGQGYNCKVVVT
jgi:hypothetical protein